MSSPNRSGRERASGRARACVSVYLCVCGCVDVVCVWKREKTRMNGSRGKTRTSKWYSSPCPRLKFPLSLRSRSSSRKARRWCGGGGGGGCVNISSMWYGCDVVMIQERSDSWLCSCKGWCMLTSRTVPYRGKSEIGGMGVSLIVLGVLNWMGWNRMGRAGLVSWGSNIRCFARSGGIL